MKLDFSINMGQRQGLTLTAQVQQAIKLLQMTNLEVNEYIEENFAVNPFVELNDKIAREKNSSASDARAETLSTAKTLKIHHLAQKNKKQKPK